MKRYIIIVVLLCIGIVAQAEPRKKKNHASELENSFGPDIIPEQSYIQAPVQQSDLIELGKLISGYINGKYREGIDVSHYQGKIDWKKVAKEGNISFAYIKCTEGATIQDKCYQYNITEAKKYKISVGVYHFYRPNTPIKDQLANLIATAKKEDMDLVPIIDVEVRGNDDIETFNSTLQAFLNEVEKFYGKRPMIYSGQNFYNKYLCGRYKGYAWMMAKYSDNPPELNDNLDYQLWQYTSDARVPGINHRTDCSRLMGNHKLEEISM